MQSHPSTTLHVAKVDYDAKGEDELSFKKGDLFHVLTNDGNWCHAKHLDSGKEGNVPSAIVMEQKSLDTERSAILYIIIFSLCVVTVL